MRYSFKDRDDFVIEDFIQPYNTLVGQVLKVFSVFKHKQTRPSNKNMTYAISLDSDLLAHFNKRCHFIHIDIK